MGFAGFGLHVNVECFKVWGQGLGFKTLLSFIGFGASRVLGLRLLGLMGLLGSRDSVGIGPIGLLRAAGYVKEFFS